MNNIFLLFIEFFKIGLFSIGGGLVTIPFINNLVEKYPSWLTYKDITNMIAISQSTPGPLGINMATFVGFKINGIFGAIIATFSLVLPSLIIIILISKMLITFNEKWYVKASFYSIRPTVLALIIYSISKIFISTFFINNQIKLKETLLFIFIFISSKIFKKIHYLFFLFFGAFIVLVFKFPI